MKYGKYGSEHSPFCICPRCEDKRIRDSIPGTDEFERFTSALAKIVAAGPIPASTVRPRRARKLKALTDAIREGIL
jgi:hypothetical protein